MTRYNEVRDTIGQTVTLESVVEEIRNPRPDVLTVLQRIKSELDDKKVEELKNQLPAVTFAGSFKIRKGGHVETPTDLVILDFDTYKDTSAEGRAELKDRLRNDENIVLVFDSPRGGIKAVAFAEGVTNKQDFKDAIATLGERYPGLDGSGKDVNRLCFLSHDPEIHVNTNAKRFKVQRRATEPLFQAPEEPMGVESTPVTPSTESARKAPKHITDFIRKGEKLKSQDTSVSRHAVMLSACIVAKRYALGGHITEEQARRRVVEEYGALFGGDAGRMHDAERAYDGAIPHAQEQGPLHPTMERKTYETAEDVPEDKLAALWARVYIPHWDNEPPYVEPVFRFMSADVGQVGSLTAIKAKPKMGKTTVALAMWTAYYLQAEHDKDTFGFTVTPPSDKPLCLYFDSEQGRRESNEAWRRALKRVGMNQDSTHEDIIGTLFCMSDLTNNIERQALLFDAMKQSAGSAGAVIVDGVADFVVDVNDAKEVDTFVQRLRTLASDYEMCAVLTIHENPGSDKERGHLGSDLARRAAATLRLEKDRRTGIHTLSIAQNRRGADYLNISFKYDETQGTHVSRGVVPPKPLDDDDTTALSQFRGKTVKKAVLVEAFMADGKRSETAAAKHVSRLTKKGFLTVRERGVYYVPLEDGGDRLSELFTPEE